MTGLHITEDQLHKEHTGIRWSGLFGVWVFLAGVFRMLASGFSDDSRLWPGCLLVCAVVMCAVSLLTRSRWKDWSFLIVTAIAVVVFLGQVRQIKNGISVLANQWLQFLTGKTGKIYLDFSTSGTKGIYIICFLILGYISAILILHAARQKIWLETVLFVICMAGVGCGFLKADAAVVVAVAGYIGLVCSKKGMVIGRKLSGILYVAGVLAVGVAAAAGISMLIHRNVPLSEEKQRIQAAVHETKYDGGTAVLSDGNLVNLGSFSAKSDETALKVTMDKPQKLYLRGMTADTYTGSAWKPLRAEAYQDGTDLFYWLHQSNFYSQTSILQSMQLADAAIEPVALKIQNVSACRKYQYLPYALAETDSLDATRIGDDQNLAEGTEQNLTYLEGSIPQWYQTASWLAAHQAEPAVADYLAKEESYRKFVYKYDLQLTDTAAGVCEQILDENEKKKEHTLSEILELVRNTLDEKLEYDPDTVTYNGNNDFFQYTMEQSKSGYSVQYATAATLMLRYLGVPSRYVEGYYVSTQDVADVAPGDTFQVTKGQAHAWAEYYLDGIGWIPFEVTPGYVDEEENQQVTQVLAGESGDGEGQVFQKNPLSYTASTYQQERETSPDQVPQFRLRTKLLLSVLGLLVLAAIAAGLIWILHRRRKLMQFWKRIADSDRRDAVTELYGYGQMLITRCQLMPQESENLAQINAEARFSQHEIPEESCQEMLKYVQMLVTQAKSRRSIWKRFAEHYLLWLYR